MYKIEISKNFKKSLNGIPKKDIARILIKIESLSKNPRQSGFEPLVNNLKGLHRIRSGNYRIIYEICDDKLIVLVLRVADRKESYKKR